jgi:trigger factor
MQVSVETTSGLERRLTVGIPSADVDVEVEKRLKEAAKTVRINGFRKGKVPLRVVKQRFGASVRQEVLGDVINRSFYEAVQKESLNPAGSPSIEPKNMDEGADVEYTATFEVYPEIELADLTDVEFTRYESELTEDDVDTMIETLRKSAATWDVVEAAAEDGNRVKINFEGKRDGEAFDGGSAEGQNLVLGSKTMIPGFEDGIVGMKAGDKKDLNLTFPEDYQVEDLRSAEVVFSVEVLEVSSQQLPEVDSSFFERFGVKDDSLDSFRAEVKKNMEREKSNALRSKLKEQVMNALLEKHEIELPKALIDNEINALRNQAVQQYGAVADKIDVKSLLPDNMFTEQAERRTALGLIISEVIKKEELKADPDKVRALVEENASTYEDPEEVINYFYSNEQMLANIEAAALEDQVVDFLIDKASVKTEAVSYEDALKPLEKPEAEAESE